MWVNEVVFWVKLHKMKPLKRFISYNKKNVYVCVSSLSWRQRDRERWISFVERDRPCGGRRRVSALYLDYHFSDKSVPTFFHLPYVCISLYIHTSLHIYLSVLRKCDTLQCTQDLVPTISTFTVFHIRCHLN